QFSTYYVHSGPFRLCRSLRMLHDLHNALAATVRYTLSLHDALPISFLFQPVANALDCAAGNTPTSGIRIPAWPASSWTVSLSQRSEEHTSELQSRENLVCRLLLEKKKRM